MKNYKKIIAGIAAAVMLFSFASCDKKNNSTNVTSSNGTTTEATSETTQEDTTAADKEYLSGTTNMSYTDAITEENSPVIMKINGIEVPYEEYACFFLVLSEKYAEDTEDYWKGTAYGEFSAEDDLKIKNEKLKKSVLEYLKSCYVVESMASKNNVTLSDKQKEEVEQEIKETDESYAKLYGEGSFDQFLAQTYRTVNQYRRELSRVIIERNLVNALYEKDFRDNEFKEYVRILQIHFPFSLEYETDEENNPTDTVKAPYEFLDNYTYTDEEKKLVGNVNSTAKQSTPNSMESYKAAILSLAEYVRAQIKNSDDYIVYMEKYNKDSSIMSKDKNGKYIGLYQQKSTTVGNFEDAAYALEENEISELVSTDSGYHIVERLPMDEEYLEDNIINLYMLESGYSYSSSYQALCREEAGKVEIEYMDCYDNININSLKAPAAAATGDQTSAAE